MVRQQTAVLPVVLLLRCTRYVRTGTRTYIAPDNVITAVGRWKTHEQKYTIVLLLLCTMYQYAITGTSIIYIAPENVTTTEERTHKQRTAVLQQCWAFPATIWEYRYGTYIISIPIDDTYKPRMMPDNIIVAPAHEKNSQLNVECGSVAPLDFLHIYGPTSAGRQI